MIWNIELSRLAQRQLSELDKSVAHRIESFLNERIANHPRPQDFASSLAGRYLGLWRFRVGDYRIICDIRVEEVRILAVAVGHRRDIYQ